MERAYACEEGRLCDFVKKLKVIFFGNGTPGFIKTTNERIEANAKAIRRMDDYEKVRDKVEKHEVVYNKIDGLRVVVIIMGLVLTALNIISMILKK